VNYKRYVMRRVRRECYRSYRQQSNLNKNRIVARKDLSTDSTNSAGVCSFNIQFNSSMVFYKDCYDVLEN